MESISIKNTQSVISSTIQLNNSLYMPRIGLGTYAMKDLPNIVYQSIKDGTRMIDTASIYQNESDVGEGINRAISEGLVKREDLFIVTKLAVFEKSNPEVAIKNSLKRLNLDYVDLYLDHWPFSIYKKKDGEVQSIPNHVVWKNLEDLVKRGYTKSIGVSNYNVQCLMDLLAGCEIKPVTNQVEFHPYLNQKNLLNYCMRNGIVITAYNSLTKGDYVHKFSHKPVNLLEEPLIKELADKYKTSTGIVCLNWAVSQDIIVIPATSNPKRMKENLEALNFKLTEEELIALEKLNLDYRFNPSTQWGPFEEVDIFA